MNIFAKLFGVENAIAATNLTPKKAKTAVRAAVLKAANDGVKFAKRSLTRHRTGLLEKSLGAKVKTQEERVTGIVGPRRGFRTIAGAIGIHAKHTKLLEKFNAQAKLISAGGAKKGAINKFLKAGSALAAQAETYRAGAQGKGGKAVKLLDSKHVKEGAVIDPMRYAHVIEKGHKKGKGKGAAHAFPFLKPAEAHTRTVAPGMIADELKAKLGV